MAAVCRAAAARGVAVGAHVSYLDRRTSGAGSSTCPRTCSRPRHPADRRAPGDRARAGARGCAYVKPHGALYNAVVHHEEQARAVVDAVAGPGAGPGTARLGRAGRRRPQRAARGPGGLRRPRLPRGRHAGAALGAGGAGHRRDEVAAPGAAARRRGRGAAVDGTDVARRGRVGVRALATPREPRRWPGRCGRSWRPTG